MKTADKLWLWLIILVLLTPLGLILPEYFKSGAAWGEWGIDPLRGFVGYIPLGMKKLAGLWKAPFPGYSLKGWENAGITRLSLGYIVSAVVGISAIVAIALIIGKILSKNERK